MRGPARILRADLRPDPAAVRVTLVHLCADLVRMGLPPEAAATVELVLAEVLNNIVEHAFAPGQAGRIAVMLRAGADHVLCEVRDDGCGMPGGRLPGADVTMTGPDPLALAEGGYGWFLIRSLAQGVTYDRGPAGNRLRFRVPVTRPTEVQ